MVAAGLLIRGATNEQQSTLEAHNISRCGPQLLGLGPLRPTLRLLATSGSRRVMRARTGA